MNYNPLGFYLAINYDHRSSKLLLNSFTNTVLPLVNHTDIHSTLIYDESSMLLNYAEKYNDNFTIPLKSYINIKLENPRYQLFDDN